MLSYTSKNKKEKKLAIDSLLMIPVTQFSLSIKTCVSIKGERPNNPNLSPLRTQNKSRRPFQGFGFKWRHNTGTDWQLTGGDGGRGKLLELL